MFIQPIFTPLGFGVQLGSFGWVFAVAALTGLLAKEQVISTFSVLAACIVAGWVAPEGESIEGLSAVEAMISATGATPAVLLAFIVFNMTTIPCFAAVATAKAELPKGKFGSTVCFWLVTSYVASCMVYLVFTWWWTVFIFVAAFVALGFGIHFYNKYRDSKKVEA